MDKTPDGSTLLSRSAGFRSVVRHVSRLLGALVVAYLITRRIFLVYDDGAVIPLGRLAAEAGVYLILSAIALTLASTIPIRREMLRINEIVELNRRDLEEKNESQRFGRHVHQAFEMAEYEPELFEVAGQALSMATVGSAEILVADASQAHVDRLVSATDREAPGVRGHDTSRLPGGQERSDTRVRGHERAGELPAAARTQPARRHRRRLRPDPHPGDTLGGPARDPGAGR